MASEITGAGGVFQMESFVRGHHVYQASWTPSVGEVLPVRRELANEHDRFAVAVLKDGEVVGHIPRTLSKLTSFFLRYDGNVVFCEVQVKGSTVEFNSEWKFCVFTSFMAVRVT